MAGLVQSGLVIPLNSAQSPLLQMVASGAMPPAERPPVLPHQRELLALWIDTPSFWPEVVQECANASPPDLDRMLEQVSVDLALWPADDQLYQRYVSLAHRASAECNPRELELERQALTKGLNLLSRDRRLHAPVAVDEQRTLYRIDLRDYDWWHPLTVGGRSFDNGWEAIAALSPYSVELTGEASAGLRSASGTAFPLLLADHVLDTALTGELYYALLGIDGFQDIYDLMLRGLAIDEEENLKDEELLRAVTTRSRISQGELLVQRQDLGIRNGALWQAVDLRERGGWSIFQDRQRPRSAGFGAL